jgi:DNA modification methylase
MTVRLLVGDCREQLRTLPDASVQCCVTSPPYFGLRDYGTASWDGGDAGCDHAGRKLASEKTGLIHGRNGAATAAMQSRDVVSVPYRDTCGKCGATRIDQQIGLESTVADYVAELVAVFREVRRVLRDDGVLFLNLGDSYAANRTYQVTDNKHIDVGNNGAMRVPDGLKPKDLIGVPWRVAFALQADGWYLRSDIIWAKPNPMPESVRDRPTKAHEYIFLLTKSPRYFWDAEAVADPVVKTWSASNGPVGRNGLAPEFGGQNNPQAGEGLATRNIRSVWTIATAPFAEAHFATFPPALAERCIKAGSAVGDVVLDPFGGAGTVSLVADRLGRDSVYIDLSAEYANMARRRITQDAPMLVTIQADTIEA